MPRRAELTPEMVTDLFAVTEKRLGYDDRYTRHTYRLARGMHGDLLTVAAKNGVGVNDLVRWLVGTFLRDYHAGTLRLPVRQVQVLVSRLGEP